LSNIAYRIFDNYRRAAHRLLSPACPLCGDRAGMDGLCADCESTLPLLGASQCPVCALPTPDSGTCGRCLRRSPAYDHVACGLRYEFPASALVLGLKYRSGLAFARPLAARLAQTLEHEPYPDLVLPMPLTPARLAGRGFNQAAELARLVAAEFGLRLSTTAASRSRDGPAQASLPWKERARNVRGAFRCDVDLEGKSVAVVDDVMTTGATLNEIATVLKRRGACRVTGWIAARTLPQH
jgi:ComF family protein